MGRLQRVLCSEALLEQLALVCKNRPTLSEALEGQLPQEVPETCGSKNRLRQELRDQLDLILDIVQVKSA